MGLIYLYHLFSVHKNGQVMNMEVRVFGDVLPHSQGYMTLHLMKLPQVR